MATTKKTVKEQKKPKKTRARKSSANEVKSDKLSFWEKRAARKINKSRMANEKRANEEKAEKANLLAEQKADEKAKTEAVSKMSYEEVEKVLEKSKKRRSHPLATLFFILLVAGLSGAAVWQYRDVQVSDKELEIITLKDEARAFEEESQAIETAKQAEEDKFKDISTDTFTIRIPREWSEKPSQVPLEESVYGDENITFRVITSQSRNSTEQYIPMVDYLWQIKDAGESIEVFNQSLHCERFDTLNNDLGSKLREHNGFQVYCDSDSEKVVIVALATPEKYGTEASSTYFQIEINDIQQIKIDDIKLYLQSFSSI